MYSLWNILIAWCIVSICLWLKLWLNIQYSVGHSNQWANTQVGLMPYSTSFILCPPAHQSGSPLEFTGAWCRSWQLHGRPQNPYWAPSVVGRAYMQCFVALLGPIPFLVHMQTLWLSPKGVFRGFLSCGRCHTLSSNWCTKWEDPSNGPLVFWGLVHLCTQESHYLAC